ncbi:MAG: 2-C-methyl-D-erythritol 4-phosphate cytidylyltransferase [Candidatus Omnitrophota bacterium]|jgi:2-C-methyl-D-erythritol 4-phosphate cytidylyltransferase
MRVSAIVLAAGRGSRLKSGLSKPLVRIKDKPIIIYSLEKLNSHPEIAEIIVVANRNNRKAITALIKEYRLAKVRIVTLGGVRRQDSVSCGLRHLGKNTGLVLIHDAARPFIEKRLISSLIREAAKCGASVLGIPVKSTLKKTSGRSRLVERTVSRKGLWEIQTPQVFRRALFLESFSTFGRGDEVTDDAMLVEKLGAEVKIVDGSSRNIKITSPEDIRVAAAIAGG